MEGGARGEGGPVLVPVYTVQTQFVNTLVYIEGVYTCRWGNIGPVLEKYLQIPLLSKLIKNAALA